MTKKATKTRVDTFECCELKSGRRWGRHVWRFVSDGAPIVTGGSLVQNGVAADDHEPGERMVVTTTTTVEFTSAAVQEAERKSEELRRETCSCRFFPQAGQAHAIDCQWDGIVEQ